MIDTTLFLKSLMTSAIKSPALSANRVALNPYLRNRCHSLQMPAICVKDTHPLHSGAQKSPGDLQRATDTISVPSSHSGGVQSGVQSATHSGVQSATHSGVQVGVAMSSSSTSVELPCNIVRRFKVPDDYAREAILPPALARVLRPVCGGGGTSTEVVQWKADWRGIIEVVCDAYAEHGLDCSEKSYQDKIFYKLYDLGVPCIRERPLYSTENGVSISRGRIDLEINGKYLIEFKVISPTPQNLRKDARQVKRYLRTYKEMGRSIAKAAVVYLYGGQVRVVEVSIADDPKMRYFPY